ncbi:hypothetical protein VMCG_06430 [Cytospora schulzeri]|uniref:DUF7726 domain-containing protein n=1 Tax=Cytospora schulzeri TaxID=448051 RepID=A0A423W7X8_9PEZI|nr:hypothetical protein VMCG_06430 [Valsa malicola]
MTTEWFWTPTQARALTAIDPNTVAMQPAMLPVPLPAPLPTVHHHTLKKVGNSADTPIEIDVQPSGKENPINSNNKNNNKKRKSDGTDNSKGPGQDNGSSKAKKPRTSRTKKSSDESSNTKASSKKAQAEALLDVSSVHLEGEDIDRVPVYETCDTIRRKIRDVLKKDGVTQAGYCRALARATTALDRPPQAVQLTRFLNNTGPLGGNTNSVFYASYVLFEKMRIRDGKPKSRFRQEMEEKHGEEGVDIENNMNTQCFTLHVTERASFDKYGKFHVTGGHAPTR